jgi:hypothetical protein
MTERITAAEGVEGHGRVLALVRNLANVRLARAECKAFRPIADGQEANLVSKVHIGFHVMGEYLGTTVVYEVAALPSEADPDAQLTEAELKPFWTINIEVCADWELQEDAEPAAEDVRCFAIGQGLMTCHPFAREAIQSFSTRMGYAAATLPIVRNPWSVGDVEVQQHHQPLGDTPGRETEHS